MVSKDNPLEIFDSCVDRESSVKKYCRGLQGKKKDKCSQNIDKAIAKGLENTIKRCVTDKTDAIRDRIAQGKVNKMSAEESYKKIIPEKPIFEGKTLRDQIDF